MMLLAVISQRSFALSPHMKSLWRPALQTFTPGPLITPLPEVPNRPAAGGVKEFGSNHRSFVCGQVVRFFSTSGRKGASVGCLFVEAIPAVAGPLSNGSVNIHDWAMQL